VEQPVAGVAGRDDAVEQVDAGRHRLDEVARGADAHQVARAVGRQLRRELGDRLPHSLGRLADREAAEGVAVEAERRDLGGRAAAQLEVEAALDDAEQLRRPPGGRARRQRAASAMSPDRALELGALGGQRRADVERHGDVDAEPRLRLDAALRRERSSLPSTCERKVTPSSSKRRRSASE